MIERNIQIRQQPPPPPPPQRRPRKHVCRPMSFVTPLFKRRGIFTVIIPFKEEEKFLALANEYELFPLKITRVKGTPTTEIKRSLMAFSRNALPAVSQETPNCRIDELIIETARHIYTPQYVALTKNFYLKM